MKRFYLTLITASFLAFDQVGYSTESDFQDDAYSYLMKLADTSKLPDLTLEDMKKYAAFFEIGNVDITQPFEGEEWKYTIPDNIYSVNCYQIPGEFQIGSITLNPLRVWTECEYKIDQRKLACMEEAASMLAICENFNITKLTPNIVNIEKPQFGWNNPNEVNIIYIVRYSYEIEQSLEVDRSVDHLDPITYTYIHRGFTELKYTQVLACKVSIKISGLNSPLLNQEKQAK